MSQSTESTRPVFRVKRHGAVTHAPSERRVGTNHISPLTQPNEPLRRRSLSTPNNMAINPHLASDHANSKESSKKLGPSDAITTPTHNAASAADNEQLIEPAPIRLMATPVVKCF
ncbi:unnamed protein product [Echinostoma caproni]|uniref:Uncharacterized protein n=1 Tax=Echinostoma caproni TaxID=27848 RepID=A0A183AJN5_9TREM|nr:unnamed protein product [Echinostoma caproni]